MPTLFSLVRVTTFAVSSITEIAVSTNAPFLSVAATLTTSILDSVGSLKAFKDECALMLEQIHEILCIIISLYSTAQTAHGALVYDIAQFTETLQRIYTFFMTQQRMSKIKQLFKKFDSELQLEACRRGLQESLGVFRAQTGHSTLGTIAQMQQDSEARHKQLVVMLANGGDFLNSEETSSVAGSCSAFGNSSISLSILPPPPQIFHGRRYELDCIVQLLKQDSAHIAILGAGGMGKTSLAIMALHHVDVAAKYPDRYFVQCHSIVASSDLLSTLASHLGMQKGSNLLGNIIMHFSRTPTLLVLDNFETPWESEARSEVEDLLSKLSDVHQLAIIVTMRGAERPQKVQWTHPFLMPLQPLTDPAALQTFIDIADDHHEESLVRQLLDLTENLPLAVNLIAHVAAYEGCPMTLSRWRTESTRMLSDGYDKQSSLEISIMLSLSSPRMAQDAQDLLSILSILPDGLSDTELIQIQFGIPNILASKMTLLRTALAYNSSDQRVKVLVPVREYIHDTHPPSEDLKLPVRRHLHRLLRLWDRNVLSEGISSQISNNIGNLNSVLFDALETRGPDVINDLESVIVLNRFRQISSAAASSHLMRLFSEQINEWQQDPIYGRYLIEKFKSALFSPVPDPDTYIILGNKYFEDKSEVEKGESHLHCCNPQF
ncbi:NB-ARC domain-containing protein [Mycena venus]|uniref:NB-ARC domain-containing protein n=1 Tax=Mycena venus TaxID=2733690 RepID=A0A8H6Y917_9AGAR|nr:NB-ARC domain-containing protein [Mycena venus]